MFSSLCLVLLLNAATSGVAAGASRATTEPANQARRSLGDQVSTNARHTESLIFDANRGGLTGGLEVGTIDDVPWRMEQLRGRTLTAKRRRRSRYHPNRPSTYVSLGKVRSFMGDVYPSGALLSALEARSYRRELILVTDTRPRAALQLYDNLAQLGLVHVLWLTNAQSICAAADGLLAARADLRRQRQAAGEAQPGAASRRRTLLQAIETPDATKGQPLVLDPDSSGHATRGLHGAEAPGSSASAYNATAAMAVLAAASETAARKRRNSITSITGVAASATGASPATSADVGCAWYSQPFPDAFVGHRRLMMRRMMLLARTVRLGYNVLSLDTDVIVFREPYAFLKSSPYGAAHMIVGKSVRGGSMVNTGVMYFQHASRTGPVSWLLSDAVERNLRWLEYKTSAAAAAATALIAPLEADRRGCWDQFLFADSVLTSVTGKLSLYYCGRPPERLLVAVAAARGGARRADEDSGWNTRHRAALGLVERQSPAELFTRDVTMVTDSQLQALVAGESFVTSWANLTIPRDPPPLLADEQGYVLPARAPGGLAARFLQLLQEDDVAAASSSSSSSKTTTTTITTSRAGARRLQQEDGDDSSDDGDDSDDGSGDDVGSGGDGGSGGDAGKGQPDGGSAGTDGLPTAHRDVEVLAYAADWLVGGWTQRGVLGYWDPALNNGVPRQVFAHLVRAPGPTSIGKEAVRMHYGEYSWELAALADGGPFPFLGSANASELPRVVALLPDVDTTTVTPIQWSNMARGLAQVALLTGRRVVWPAVPCASKWVQPNPGSRRALPLNPNLRFLAHGSFSSGLMCTPAAALHQKCLFERWSGGRNDSSTGNEAPAQSKEEAAAEVPRREGPRGLLPVEFEMLLRVLPPSARPGQHNTVHLQTNDDYDDSGGGERPVMFDEPPRTEGITYVKASAVVGPLREGALASQPVLYFAQRTFLTQLDKLGDPALMTRYRTFRNECPALK